MEGTAAESWIVLDIKLTLKRTKIATNSLEVTPKTEGSVSSLLLTEICD